jgi:hypothetical protein
MAGWQGTLPGGGTDCYPYDWLQTECATHPISYPIDTKCSVWEDKAASIPRTRKTSIRKFSNSGASTTRGRRATSYLPEYRKLVLIPAESFCPWFYLMSTQKKPVHVADIKMVIIHLYCHNLGVCAWLIRWISKWMIGFIYTVCTPLGTHIIVQRYTSVIFLSLH